MSSNKLNDQLRKTEEIQDIIDRMPYRTGRIVAVLIIGLSTLLIFFGWIIEYPETVSGPVSITARQAPVRLVSNNSGKLHLLKSNGDPVLENEMLAFMDNPAKLDEVLVVENFIHDISLDSLISSPTSIQLPEISAMGELSSVYFSFCDAFEKLSQYCSGRLYDKRKAGLVSQLNSQIILYQHNKEQMDTKSQSLKIAGRNMHRDSLLYHSSAIAELDLERSSINYLGLLESAQAMNKEDASYQLQINDTRHQLQLLEVEQQETEMKLKMTLVSAYNELSNSIRQWKQKYVYIAPFGGTLEYLNFWRENDFLLAGSEVFSILPSDNPPLGQVYLPSHGAGKVEVGQDVIIKLDNYPYMEYGAINGKVKSVSMLTNQTELASGSDKIATYLVNINLPMQLTTNYGATLDFRYEIKGVAEIITKPRKLLERLFDNLKYIASKK